MVPVVVRADGKQSEKIRANRDLLASGPRRPVDDLRPKPRARPGVAASAVVRGMKCGCRCRACGSRRRAHAPGARGRPHPERA
jgi:hypothetical protein